MTLYVLRDLPGVSALEAQLREINAHPNPRWAPENDQLRLNADRLSFDLFGVTAGEAADALHGFLESGGRVDELTALTTTELTEEMEQAIWLAGGWDVTDGAGALLACLEHLYLSIICVAKGLAGRRPGAPMSEAEIAEHTSAWARSMEEAARQFKPSSRTSRRG